MAVSTAVYRQCTVCYTDLWVSYRVTLLTIGNPDTAQLGFTAQLGSGFLAESHNEFLQANIGPMVTWKVARQVQLFGDGTYQVRYRKSLSHGGNLAVGVRYLFD